MEGVYVETTAETAARKKEALSVQRKTWYLKNKERIKHYNDSTKLKKKAWYEANKASVSASRKKYYSANTDVCRQRVKAYQDRKRDEAE